MIELDEDILDDVWQRYVRANTHADAYRMVPKHCTVITIDPVLKVLGDTKST